MSIIGRVPDRKLPIFIAVAEYDMPQIQRQNKRLIDALFARDGKLPNVKTALGHNHISIIEHFGTPDESLVPNPAIRPGKQVSLISNRPRPLRKKPQRSLPGLPE